MLLVTMLKASGISDVSSIKANDSAEKVVLDSECVPILGTLTVTEAS